MKIMDVETHMEGESYGEVGSRELALLLFKDLFI